MRRCGPVRLPVSLPISMASGTGLLYTWRKQMLTAGDDRDLRRSRSRPNRRHRPSWMDRPCLTCPRRCRITAAAAMDAAAEIDLACGTRVRVGNGASAALLRELFAALHRR